MTFYYETNTEPFSAESNKNTMQISEMNILVIFFLNLKVTAVLSSVVNRAGEINQHMFMRLEPLSRFQINI